MASVVCPYCYQHIDNTRLAFQCVGVGAPGRPGCTRREDPVRKELFDYAGATLPTFPAPRGGLRTVTRAVCADCGGPTGARACPACHTPLSTTFVGGRSPLVGMVGGKGAGKTVYLTVLNQQLHSTVRRRFDADVRLAGDQQGGLSTTQGYLAAFEKALFDDGRLPDQTASSAAARKVPLVVEWRRPRPRLARSTVYETTTLSFYDTAGEDLSRQETAHTQTYLGVCSGLIVLLDPWQLPGVRDRLDVPDAAVEGAEPPGDVLHRITELLRASHGTRGDRRVRTPLAVVFAKMDALYDELDPGNPVFAPVAPVRGYDDESGRAVHEYVRSLLHGFGADDIDTALRSHYEDFRYFAVSALGAQPDYQGRQVDPGGVTPVRVEEPLLWLLHRLGVVERSRP